jgi:hypothetical protein
VFGGETIEPGVDYFRSDLWAYRKVPFFNEPESIYTGSAGGGTIVTLKGSNWGTDVSHISVELGSHLCTELSLTTIDDQQSISCKAPAGVGSNVTAAVYVTAGTRWTSELHPLFSFDAPTITAVSSLGALPTGGGGKVKVLGTNLGRPITLQVGTADSGAWITHAVCANVAYTSLEEVSCELSPGTGNGLGVRVKAQNLYSAASEAPFLLSYDFPEIHSVNVSSQLTTTGHVAVTIYGSNFGSDLLSFEDNRLNITVGQRPCQAMQLVSPNELQCNVMEGSGRDLRVVVTVSGQAAFLDSSISYLPPILRRVHPMEFATDTSTKVTIYGENFGPRAADITVQIGGQACTGIFLKEAHMIISCNSPMIPYEGQQQVVVIVGGQRAQSFAIEVLLPGLLASLRTIIFTVTSVALFLISLLFIAVFRLRGARVFKASSPRFLFIFIFGSCMQVFLYNPIHICLTSTISDGT